jgi:uracil-DNA glycosylase family 4
MNKKPTKSFNLKCRLCPRLAEFLDEVRENNPGYYGLPVPSFGANNAQLVVVGLAPGMHGANRTGRPFTGDHAGVLLYETLFQFGFANQPTGESPDDGLALQNCRIANAVKCLPPQNKPLGNEINTCNQFLSAELEESNRPIVIVALGTIAHGAVLTALGYKKSHAKFSHAAVHHLSKNRILVDSYHCSRYNTQTRRLTPEMFQQVFATARDLIESLPATSS